MKITNEHPGIITPGNQNTFMKRLFSSPNNFQHEQIRKFGIWTYVKNQHDTIDLGTLENYISPLSNWVLRTYLHPMMEFKVSDDMFSKTSLNESVRRRMINEIFRMTNQLFQLIGESSIMCRLRSENYSFIIDVGRSISRYNTYAGTGVAFCTILYNNLKCVAKISLDKRIDYVESYNASDIERFNYSPFYLGKKDRVVEDVIKSENRNYSTDDVTLVSIHQALSMTLNTLGNNDSNLKQSHSKTELYFIRKIMNSMDSVFMPIDIQNWVVEQKDVNQFNYLNTKERLVNNIHHYNPAYPLIDLNKNEMSFIRQYVEDKKMIGASAGTMFDIVPYLDYSPYGRIFRYKIIDELIGDDLEIIISYILDKEKDLLRVILSLDISDDMTIFSYMNFENISSFHTSNSMTNINTSIIFTGHGYIPYSIDNVKNLTPIIFRSPEKMNQLIMDVLSICIVIYDRPKRLRVVKCTSKDTPVENIKKRDTKNTKRNSEFNIVRILKSVSDAKAYVSRMVTDECDDREYVLESWPRKGHYRKYQDGSIVWIPQTTCRRHLPLSDKEIHIKL